MLHGSPDGSLLVTLVFIVMDLIRRVFTNQSVQHSHADAVGWLVRDRFALADAPSHPGLALLTVHFRLVL
jgi:hypothetical protein